MPKTKERRPEIHRGLCEYRIELFSEMSDRELRQLAAASAELQCMLSDPKRSNWTTICDWLAGRCRQAVRARNDIHIELRIAELPSCFYVNPKTLGDAVGELHELATAIEWTHKQSRLINAIQSDLLAYARFYLRNCEIETR